MTTTDLDLRSLFTPDWRVHGSLYRDPAIFALEQERIFRRTWLYLAHTSQLRNPGDYVTTWAGTQPVIVSRGADDGEIHALLNRCRHRGATVCQDAAGNANYFRCAYHGWTYLNDGRLNGVPYRDAYAELPKEELGLVRLPRVAEFKGFVFGSFAKDGPDLETHLGNARPYLEHIANLGPEGIRLSAGAHRLALRGNWKLQVENTVDNYHFGFVHKSFLDILDERTGGNAPDVKRQIEKDPTWRTLDLGNGHAVHEFGDPNGPGHGGSVGDLPFNLNVFPNLCFVGAQLRLILPREAERTEVLLYPMLHEGASDEHNARILRTHEGFYGPSGFGGPDDLEIAFERVTDGLQAIEDDWILLSRGATREQVVDGGVRVGGSADEVPQRALYRGWIEQMTGEPAGF